MDRVRRSCAFTLVEIMIVVVIIGLLAAMAIPALNKVRAKSQATTIANDVRTFRDAIEAYVLEKGVFPQVTGGGFPGVFSGWISRAKWRQGSALSGASWDYYSPGGGYIPELVLDTPGQDNSAIFALVDDILDDGGAETGQMIYEPEFLLYQFPQ